MCICVCVGMLNTVHLCTSVMNKWDKKHQEGLAAMNSIFAPTHKHQVHTFLILPSYFALPSTQFHHLFGIMKELVFVFKTHVPSPLDVDPNQWCIWLYHGCTAAVLIGHGLVPTGNHKVGPQIKLILLFTIYTSLSPYPWQPVKKHFVALWNTPSASCWTWHLYSCQTVCY